jgi:dUTP pyrophosphatase
MLEIKLLRSNAIVPTAAHTEDAAVDLFACLDEPVQIYPGEQVAIPTGIAISLPPCVAGMIMPRSGLARKHKLTISNPPGLIDPGYHGEVIVLLRSFAYHGNAPPYVVQHGDRIAQLLLVPVLRYPFEIVTEFTSTSERGANGFGSSGV